MKCFDLNRNFCNQAEEEVEFLIDKPVVPFIYQLNKRLRPNTTFIIQGVVDDNAVRFEVNLVAGQSDKSDIVFHFNPRLEKLYSARNSRFAGAWGAEEGANQAKFPFRCGQPFCLEIYTSDVKYLVAVNGAHYCMYKHRAPVNSVVGLRVEGGVRLSQVLHFTSDTYPSLLPQLLPVPEAKTSQTTNSSQGSSLVYNLKSPLQPQSSIIVQGVVNDNASRMEVDLLTGTGDHEKPDIGFHFNPRFDQVYSARNTRLLGVWGSEEGGAHERFPFRRGQPFYLEIYTSSAKYLIAVDGMHYTSYRHRVPLARVTKVHIHGGVTVSNVHFQHCPRYPSPLPRFLSSSEEEVLLQAGDFTKTSSLKVPFTHELKSRLHPESSVIVQGVVENNATRFEVDFIIGHNERPDIAFHLNPRLDSLYVARNSRFNGVWGHEEGESERKFPFRCGQPFFLEIFLTNSKFMVAVDGDHYCSFKYRASLVSITRVCVQGGVKLSQVMMHTSSSYPTPMPQFLPCPDMQPVVLRSANNLKDKSDPFDHKLDFKLCPQSSLIVQGEVADSGIRFAVNLLIDYGDKQDIALHFNPRLNQGYTARNSKLGGSWGTEEGSKKEKFPFRNGFPFYLEIFFTQSKFMVAVDGTHYCSYKHRVPLAKVTHVQVEGGVHVSQVLVHPSTGYPSAVLEFVARAEDKPGLQAVRAGSVASINQVLPYYHELRSSLHPQSSIFVQGVVDDRAVRVEVNLMMGRGDRPDIAFHFNPRMDQWYSARNSRLSGCWGPEEGNSHQRFPFARGRPFYLEIFLTHSQFLVAVNGLHYCSYGYRAPLSKVTCLEVCGVRDAQAEVQPASSYPTLPPPQLGQCPYRLRLVDHAVTDNTTKITPVYGALGGNLRANSKIEIKGKVKLLPHSFYVNLQQGADVWPHPLVPLHTSVRFCHGGDQVTLANSWARGKWGGEEKVLDRFLFDPGCHFTMRIWCQEDKYIVHVDDQFLLAYKHRVPYNNVDTLFIQGDVFIYNITLHL